MEDTLRIYSFYENNRMEKRNTMFLLRTARAYTRKLRSLQRFLKRCRILCGKNGITYVLMSGIWNS